LSVRKVQRRKPSSWPHAAALLSPAPLPSIGWRPRRRCRAAAIEVLVAAR
jgi:hypothetical protein